MNASWDLFITMFFVIMTVYGLLLGRGRIFTIVLSTYVGFVVSNEFSTFVFEKFSKAASFNNTLGTSQFGAKVITFAAVVFLLTMRSDVQHQEERGLEATVITAVYGFLAAGLIITSILSFMGDSEKMTILSNSVLATRVDSYRDLFLVGPIVIALFTSFVKGKMPRMY